MATINYGTEIGRITRSLQGKPPAREPLSSAKKKKVCERANNTCEYRGCKLKENLQFHHKNMKNYDDCISNIELLCPNHHAKRHSEKRRKKVGYDILTGKEKTRLVKKTQKKTTKKKPIKKKKPKSVWDMTLEDL